MADRQYGPTEWVGSIGRATLVQQLMIQPTEGQPFEVALPSQQVNFCNYDRRVYNLASGDNAIVIPANTTWIWIELPLGNAATVLYQPVSTDAGQSLNPIAVTGPIAIPAAVAGTITLNASAIVTGVIITCI